MTTFNGKCHCGQTEWTAKLDTTAHVLCHCNTCKTLGGGAYTLNQIIPKADLTVTKGQDALKCYTYHGDSGKPVHCYYCPNCTTHVYHHQTVLGDKVIARTILLDGGEKFEPGAEIYGKVRLGWEKEVAETFETLPPGL